MPRLEHRLYGPGTTDAMLQDGCEFAVAAGLAAVICRPEHVPLAAQHVAGSPVEVVAPLGFGLPASAASASSTAALVAQASALVWDGASEVAMVACRAQLAPSYRDRFEEQLAAVSRAVTLHRGRVRALVNCDGMRPEELYSACRMLDDAGVRLVQGGSWRGDRTGLSQIEVMRQALPRAVQLKWTNPVRSVEVMLICIAEGVGRFNADVTTLLAAANRRSHLAPLMVPVPTLDYERRTRPNAGPQTHPTFQVPSGR